MHQNSLEYHLVSEDCNIGELDLRLATASVSIAVFLLKKNLLANGLVREVQYNPKPSGCDDYLCSTIEQPFKEEGLEETPEAASPLLPASFSGRRFSGWRVGMTASAVAAMISLLLNLGVAIGVAIKFGMPNGIGTLFQGSCDKVESMNFWIHLGINALNTILLGGLEPIPSQKIR